MIQRPQHDTGIDLAEAAIREYRSEFKGKNNCTFEIAAFEA